MKRVTTHPNKKSRQERALELAEQRVTYWELQVTLPEDAADHSPIPPNGRGNKATAEQKLERAKADYNNLLAKGVRIVYREESQS